MLTEPTTISEALNQAATLIEDQGWLTLDPVRGNHNSHCAVTALVHLVPNNLELRLDVMDALTENLGLESPTEIGKWNDNQENAQVVIDKLREVAKLHG